MVREASKTRILPKQGYPADLAPYMNKKVLIMLNGNRRILGRIRGFDEFMNLSLDDTVESVNRNGTDVTQPLYKTVIRAESIIFWECIDKVESLKPKD